MHKLEILVICRHEQILQTILRLLNNNEQWHATGVVTDDEAIARFTEHAYGLVLLGNGINEAEEHHLREVFTAQNPNVVIVQHYGGGSGLLSVEIYEALSRKNI